MQLQVRVLLRRSARRTGVHWRRMGRGLLLIEAKHAHGRSDVAAQRPGMTRVRLARRRVRSNFTVLASRSRRLRSAALPARFEAPQTQFIPPFARSGLLPAFLSGEAPPPVALDSRHGCAVGNAPGSHHSARLGLETGGLSRRKIMRGNAMYTVFRTKRPHIRALPLAEKELHGPRRPLRGRMSRRSENS